MFVLEASVSLAWCFHDEGDGADVVCSRPVAPGKCHHAITLAPRDGDVLTLAERKGRLSEAATAAFVNMVQRLPTVVDSETSERALREILILARGGNSSPAAGGGTVR